MASIRNFYIEKVLIDKGNLKTINLSISVEDLQQVFFIYLDVSDVSNVLLTIDNFLGIVRNFGN